MKFPFKHKNRSNQIPKMFPSLQMEENVGIVGKLDHMIVGKNVLLQRNVVIHLGGFEWDHHSGSFRIGNNSVISYGTVIFAAGGGGVEIGSNFDCGPNCGIFSSQSNYDQRGSHIFKKVTIGDNVILYHNVTIVPGVTIGNGAVIAAGSVVTKDVEANALYGGVPAKFIKHIDTNH